MVKTKRDFPRRIIIRHTPWNSCQKCRARRPISRRRGTRDIMRFMSVLALRAFHMQASKVTPNPTRINLWMIGSNDKSPNIWFQCLCVMGNSESDDIAKAKGMATRKKIASSRFSSVVREIVVPGVTPFCINRPAFMMLPPRTGGLMAPHRSVPSTILKVS